MGATKALPGQQQPRAHSYRAAECFDVCIEQMVGPSHWAVLTGTQDEHDGGIGGEDVGV